MNPITKVSWCPGNDWHLASCQSSQNNNDHNIHVWDIRRPYLPYSSFNGHKELVTGSFKNIKYIINVFKTSPFRVILKNLGVSYHAAEMDV